MDCIEKNAMEICYTHWTLIFREIGQWLDYRAEYCINCSSSLSDKCIHFDDLGPALWVLDVVVPGSIPGWINFGEKKNYWIGAGLGALGSILECQFMIALVFKAQEISYLEPSFGVAVWHVFFVR